MNPVASIYEQVLGADFAKLHPRIRQRFGITSGDRIAAIGQGWMSRIWFSKWAAIPLYIGTSRHIMFPQGGYKVPFSIENYAYVDSFGRETVTWIRNFKFPNAIRHFDATMVYSGARSCVVDYLGNKQHLAVDLAISVDPNGGIRLRSGEQRFYEGLLHFRFPRLLTGTAEVCEWYDDREQRFNISVDITNPLIGPVFRYDGYFQTRYVDMTDSPIPLDAIPLREESRE
jgi:hypothetical protein